ncbi:MAG: PrgI family mobile element protein [Patescibacteria group bacterium]
MEQHPIPRQITTFEFKLIGFMTLKQFIYLVVAFPIAYIVFALFPIPLLNILLAVIIVVAGLVFAFVPIQDRPVEVWIRNLFKRLQSPTQYFYHKDNKPLYFLNDLYFLADPHRMLAHIESKEKLAQYLAMTKQKQRPDHRKKQIGSLMHEPSEQLKKDKTPYHAPSSQNNVPQQPVAAQQLSKPEQQQPQNNIIDVPIIPPKQQGVPSYQPKVQPVQAATEDQLKKAQTRQAPVVTVIPLQKTAPPPTPTPPPTATPDTASTPTPDTAPMASASYQQEQKPTENKPLMQAQVVMEPPKASDSHSESSAMNAASTAGGDNASQRETHKPIPKVEPGNQPFYMGVVRTGKRIPLPGVMVYLKDASGNPIRLMKTNPHGVFATYNALPSGTYTLEIKDPNGTYFFDTMNVSVKEHNPLPVEVQSKEIL